MTLMSGEKYSENKWKNGYGGDYNGGSTKRLPILSLTSSMILFLAIVLIVVLKFLAVLTGKPAALLLIESGIFTLEKVQLIPNWLSENCSHLFWPSVKGLSWTMFSWMLLYLDSSVPGENPPATLSPRKTRFGDYGTATFHHIGYLTSLATGLVVFSLSLVIV